MSGVNGNVIMSAAHQPFIQAAEALANRPLPRRMKFSSGSPGYGTFFQRLMIVGRESSRKSDLHIG
jgi:hypothetical protein